LTLETLCRNVSSDNGVPIRFDRHAIPRDVPEDSALCLFRVAQEALQNAVKHSGAHGIDVTVTATPSHLTLQIIDDGGGFDPLASPSAGLGLLTMRERVELTGGRLRIDTSNGRGTVIEAMVPLMHNGNGVGHHVDRRSGEAALP
jgi:signal transduction histidine kinase